MKWKAKVKHHVAQLLILTAAGSGAAIAAAPINSQQVFFVGNNWDGTVTVIRSSGDFGKIGVINMIPAAGEEKQGVSLREFLLLFCRAVC